MTKMVDVLFERAQEALAKAYVPYSQFPVGACIVSDTGRFFVGCNVENASYGLTACAELAAISAMVVAGDRKIVDIAIVSAQDIICPPCGGCRQRIQEFSDENTTISLFAKEKYVGSYNMATLLPLPFGRSALGEQ